MSANDPFAAFARYPLLDALRERRSRRFGVGMAMASGPLAYRSRRPPQPLSEDEEAVLAFAACGVTGHALGELVYEPAGGGAIMAGMLGRTVPSGDAIHSVAVFVTNADATYLLRRPQDFAPDEIPDLADLARRGELTELYRRSRVLVKRGRTAPPLEPLFNLKVNQWSLYAPSSSYFLPVNELTFLYINGLLEILDPDNGVLVLDERAGFRPAGLGAFVRSRGGHLHDERGSQRVLTIQQLEALVSEFAAAEQGMVLQNLQLAAQAMGLGGFPHWAAHPFGWLEALGFRVGQLPASRYLGMGPLLSRLARLTRRDPPVTLALGLEVDGRPLLVPHCPPWFPSMRAAVEAVVEQKFGEGGVFRGGVRHSAWREPEPIAAAARPPDPATVEATVAYCEYVYRRYGRFPAYQPPFRTILGFQTGHLDLDFYQRFYRPEAISESHRRHQEVWHPGAGAE